MNPGQQPLQETGGTANAPPPGSSDVTVVNPPGGTVNTIPKWTAATVLGNSAIADDGTSVTVTNRAVTATVDDAFNVAVVNILSLLHTTSGVAGNGIGSGMTFIAEDSAGQSENMVQLNALLTNATSGAETSQFDIYTRTGGAVPALVVSFSQVRAQISAPSAAGTAILNAGAATGTPTAGHAAVVGQLGAEVTATTGNTTLAAPAGAVVYNNKTVVTPTGRAINFTFGASFETVNEVTVVGLTGILDSADPVGTRYEVYGLASLAVPNFTLTPNGGKTISSVAGLAAASVNVTAQGFWRIVTKTSDGNWLMGGL